MSEPTHDERPSPPDDSARSRAAGNPQLMELLRKSIEAKLRDERPIPATELMEEVRALRARD